MFQNIFLGFLSGLIQGVAEWLPVSSKTMLFFIFYLCSLSPSDSYLLSLLLNGSTVIAASIYFRRELLRMLNLPNRIDDASLKLLIFLIISTLVTGILGVLLSTLSINLLSRLHSSDALIFIGFMLFVTALLNWWRMKIKTIKKSINDVNVYDALIAGIAQSFSILPGVSRSGVTMLALLLRGYDVKDSLIISFLMSIPATLGGSIYAYIISPKIFEFLGLTEVLFSFSVATIISLATINMLLRLSQKFKSHIFLSGLSIITIIHGLILSS
jgi:undecaprenyl-diphosphatase